MGSLIILGCLAVVTFIFLKYRKPENVPGAYRVKSIRWDVELPYTRAELKEEEQLFKWYCDQTKINEGLNFHFDLETYRAFCDIHANNIIHSFHSDLDKWNNKAGYVRKQELPQVVLNDIKVLDMVPLAHECSDEEVMVRTLEFMRKYVRLPDGKYHPVSRLYADLPAFRFGEKLEPEARYILDDPYDPCNGMVFQTNIHCEPKLAKNFDDKSNWPFNGYTLDTWAALFDNYKEANNG